MIVICSRCNKVRQPDKTWELAKEYPLKGMLSHGYCPSCAKQVKEEWQAEIVSGRAPVFG